ncbi:hypothetical protein PV646_41355 [Streptomyces sp. ID05-26A]|nr:hypothetical protein [Streptomyces sp. ID05-26A]
MMPLLCGITVARSAVSERLLDGTNKERIVGFDYNNAVPNKYTGGFNESVGEWKGRPDDRLAGVYQPPRSPTTGEGGGTDIRVNTDALRHFAGNLRTFEGWLRGLLPKLDGVRLAPGGFYDAKELTSKVVGVNGSPSIHGSTREFVVQAIHAFKLSADDLEAFALTVTNSEELNKATGDDLLEVLHAARPEITKAVGGADVLSAPPTSTLPPTTTGGPTSPPTTTTSPPTTTSPTI